MSDAKETTERFWQHFERGELDRLAALIDPDCMAAQRTAGHWLDGLSAGTAPILTNA